MDAKTQVAKRLLELLQQEDEDDLEGIQDQIIAMMEEADLLAYSISREPLEAFVKTVIEDNPDISDRTEERLRNLLRAPTALELIERLT